MEQVQQEQDKVAANESNHDVADRSNNSTRVNGAGDTTAGNNANTLFSELRRHRDQMLTRMQDMENKIELNIQNSERRAEQFAQAQLVVVDQQKEIIVSNELKKINWGIYISAGAAGALTGTGCGAAAGGPVGATIGAILGAAAGLATAYGVEKFIEALENFITQLEKNPALAIKTISEHSVWSTIIATCTAIMLVGDSVLEVASGIGRSAVEFLGGKGASEWCAEQIKGFLEETPYGAGKHAARVLAHTISSSSRLSAELASQYSKDPEASNLVISKLGIAGKFVEMTLIGNIRARELAAEINTNKELLSTIRHEINLVRQENHDAITSSLQPTQLGR